MYLTRFNFVLYYYPGKFIDKLDILFQRPNHGNGSHDNENMILIKPDYLTVCVMKGLAIKGEKLL